MIDFLLQFAGRLRFPVLFFVTAAFFVVDLFVPDLVPFADEILLGLLTLVFGAWRKRRSDHPKASKAPRQPGRLDDVIDLPADDEPPRS